MIRIILRLLNAPALVMLVILAVAIQTSIFASPALNLIQPDLILIAVIWCGLKRSFTEGGILTLLFANIAEIHSSSPQGVLLIAYMGVYIGIRIAARVLVMPSKNSVVLATALASVGWKLLILFTIYLLGKASHQWEHTLAYLFPGAFFTGVISYWIYEWLARFDWVTFKDVKAQQILEDELQVEREGW